MMHALNLTKIGLVASGRAKRLLRALRRFGHDNGGAYAMLTAILMPVIIGGLGLGTETGLWYFKHLSMQAAADSAAMSAAVAYTAGGAAPNIWRTEAKGVAARYGFVNGANGTIVTPNMPPKSGPHQTTPGAVEVIISQPQARIFSALWTTSLIPVSARSVAVAPSNGTGCVLTLNGTASGAVTAQGNSAMSLNGCSLYNNSNSSSALTAGGASTLSALTVNVVGGISGSSHITTSNDDGVMTGSSPASDPYAEVSSDSFSGCMQSRFSARKTQTINPGVYCNGMTLNAGAVVTLNPGIYYIDQGSLTVNGGATLQGTGVTIVLTSSTGSNYATATINGGATVNLTAPTSGPTAGIAIYGDRNMPAGTALKFTGGSSQIIGGAIYAPTAAVSFSGNSGAGSGTGCMQLIAGTVTFTGTAGFAINCSGYGTTSIGAVGLSLVE